MLHDALDSARAHHNIGLEAVVLNNLGNVFMSQKTPDFSQALDFYRQSAKAAQQARHPALAARALTHAAMAAVEMHQTSDVQPASGYRDARAFLHEAVAHMPRVAPTHAKSYDFIDMGQLYHQLAEADPNLVRRAAQVFGDAARIAQRLGDPRAASYAWGHLGTLYEEAHRYQEALRLTRQAVLAAQQVYVPHALYQWQWQTGRILNALGDRDAAIAAYQRAVTTLQALRHELPQAYGKIRVASTRTTLGPLYFQLVDLLLHRAAVSSPEQAVQDLEQAQNTIERFKQAELQEYFGDTCVVAQPHLTSRKSLKEISAEVARAAVVVYPILLPDRMELLVRPPSGLKRFTVAAPAAELESVAIAFRRALQEGSEKLYRRHAQQLYT